MRRPVSNSDVIDDGIGSYNYNNANDCANFCPDTGVRICLLNVCYCTCDVLWNGCNNDFSVSYHVRFEDFIYIMFLIFKVLNLCMVDFRYFGLR